MKVLNVCAVGAVLALTAPMASAATVTIESITGSWVAISDNNTYGVNIDNSGPDADVFWGRPPVGGSQSGYAFDSAVPPVIAPNAGQEFEIGTFSHHNWPIYDQPGGGQEDSIEWAELQVSFDVKINNQMFNVTRNFTFDHTETRNDGVNGSGNCQFSGYAAGLDSEGCADRVIIEDNVGATNSVMVDGLLYTFDLSGFEVDGQLTSTFFTREKAVNEAILVGKYTVEEISPVPLPAAGWLLIAGVGGLAALKRKKRANA